MLLVGLMSGTSLDGVDAALVRIAGPTRVELLGFVHRGYTPAERAQIEAVLAGASIADTAHDCTSRWPSGRPRRSTRCSSPRTSARTRWRRSPSPARPSGTSRRVVTLQLGEPAVLAERFGVRIVSNLRARDVAAGGQGAPLVPMVDALLFGAADHARVLLNLGGMANVTWVPPARRARRCRGGRHRPGDGDHRRARAARARRACPSTSTARSPQRARVQRDRAGRVAGRSVLCRTPPPRSTGRERFGRDVRRSASRRGCPGPTACGRRSR